MSDGVEFEVREARLGISSHVSLYGRRTSAQVGRGNRRLTRIGLVADIELAATASAALSASRTTLRLTKPTSAGRSGVRVKAFMLRTRP